MTIGASITEDQTLRPIFEGLLDDSPSGGTPLCRHVSEIIQEITPMAPMLRSAGKQAAIIIATDGE